MKAAHITRLRLTDFRGYAALDLDVDARPVVIYGANGAGKTNILEAISFLSPGKGLRGADTTDVVRHDAQSSAQGWGVFAEASGARGALTLASGAMLNARRETRLDGSPASRNALARAFPMLALQPEEDRLFAGPRADRLKFFDGLVSAADPAHSDAVAAYEKLRRQRQRVLEDGGADSTWLDAIETDMAAYGVAIAALRLGALSRLQVEIDAAPDSAFPKAALSLDGATEADLAGGLNSSDAEDALTGRLKDGRDRDAASGRSLSLGPHRSDLTARHTGKDRPAGECSTGEQKALVVRLALAQARVLARSVGAAPLLLLDEACAHLDAERRAGLAEAITDLGAQAWLTGVERGLFEAFDGQAQMLEISAATVKPG